MPYRKRGEKREVIKQEVESEEFDDDESLSNVRCIEMLDNDVAEGFFCIRPSDTRTSALTTRSKRAEADEDGGTTKPKRVRKTVADNHRCRFCFARFQKVRDRLAHERGHAGEANQCEVCKKTFSQIHRLKMHFRTHTRDRPFKCDICSKSFMQSQHLKKHRFIHTGLRPWQCQVCAKAFRYYQELKRHARIHTGERPYECDVCGKAFNQSSILQVHQRIHTGEKPFQCSICSKFYRESGTLTKHMRKHFKGAEGDQRTIFLGPEDLQF